MKKINGQLYFLIRHLFPVIIFFFPFWTETIYDRMKGFFWRLCWIILKYNNSGRYTALVSIWLIIPQLAAGLESQISELQNHQKRGTTKILSWDYNIWVAISFHELNNGKMISLSTKQPDRFSPITEPGWILSVDSWSKSFPNKSQWKSSCGLCTLKNMSPWAIRLIAKRCYNSIFSSYFECSPPSNEFQKKILILWSCSLSIPELFQDELPVGNVP